MFSIDRIYLDIDGVFLDKNYKQMPYLKEFIQTVFNVVGDEVYWLTEHSKHGDNDIVLEHLGDTLDKDIFNMIKPINNCK